MRKSCLWRFAAVLFEHPDDRGALAWFSAPLAVGRFRLCRNQEAFDRRDCEENATVNAKEQVSHCYNQKIALMSGKRLIRSTTVLCVRRNGSVVMAGDGQVTLGEGVIKHTAKKIRRLYQEKILAGFAGSTADAFSLFSRFEAKLEQYHGNVGRAAVELAKDWRTDKFLRHLEALLLVADKEQTFLLSGQGDVIEPDGGIAAIGSGGPYAQAAAQALAEHTQLSARQIAEEAMKIAGKMCIYTNEKVTIEEL